MKAWRFHAFGDMRLDEVPMPKPGKGEVLLKVRAVQPSITEIVAARGGAGVMASPLKKLIESRAPISLLGHEFAGDVVGTGPGCRWFKTGDRVAAITTAVPCHKCVDCLGGREFVCRIGPRVGMGVPGCFAEYSAIPEEALVRLPDNIGYNEGACFQTADTPMGVVLRADLKGGETMAVLGQGPIGSGVMQIARAKGAGRVIVTDIRQENLDFARRIGADEVVDASRNDVVKVIRDLTGGKGVDIAVDAAGGDPRFGLADHRTLHQAVDIVKQQGMVIQPAAVEGVFDVQLEKLSEKRLLVSWGMMITREDMDDLVNLIATGKVNLKHQVTHTVDGIEKLPEAFEITANKAKHRAINPCQVNMA